MRVTKIKIKNLFGIKEYETGGKDIELSGKNGTGKSSVLDAIKYALTNKSERQYIVRDGESEGEILIECDNGLSINRKARIAQTDYKSVKQNGMTINSPETFLKDIITPLQLSPVEFMGMDEKSQNAIILSMIDYPWTMETIREWFGEIPAWVNYDQNILAILHDVQDEKGDYFMNRQDINRDIRAKRSVVTDIGSALPPDYDGNHWENVSLNELYTKIEKIRKSNETIEKAKRLKEGHDGKIRSFEADREIALAALDREITAQGNNIDTELATLRERIVALEKEKAGLTATKADKEAVIRSEHEKKVAQFESEIAAYAEYADKDIEPVDALLQEANTAEKMKSHINEWRRMLGLQEEIETLTKKSASLTEKIEKARTLPGEILETASIPITGLSVKDGIPLINGLPISNLSEGEKLDLCIDVAIQNPAGLQIILIDGVEKLSTEMRNRLYSKCKEKGLQFISTRTTDSEDLTVYEL
jgi:exonuclease SbcC